MQRYYCVVVMVPCHCCLSTIHTNYPDTSVFDASCSPPPVLSVTTKFENLYSPQNGRNNNELTNSTNKQQ